MNEFKTIKTTKNKIIIKDIILKDRWDDKTEKNL